MVKMKHHIFLDISAKTACLELWAGMGPNGPKTGFKLMYTTILWELSLGQKLVSNWAKKCQTGLQIYSFEVFLKPFNIFF